MENLANLLRVTLSTGPSENVREVLGMVAVSAAESAEKQEQLMCCASLIQGLLLAAVPDALTNALDSSASSPVESNTSSDSSHTRVAGGAISPIAAPPAAVLTVEVIHSALLCMLRLIRRKTLDRSTLNLANHTRMSQELHMCDIVIGVLNCPKYSVSAAVCDVGCSLLMALCSDCPPNQMRCASRLGGEGLINALVVHVADPVVCEFGCRAVRNIAALDEAAAELVIVQSDAHNMAISDAVMAVGRRHMAPLPAASSAAAFDGSSHGTADKDKDKDKDLSTPAASAPAADPTTNFVVLEAVLWAIVNLSCDDHISTILGGSGAVLLAMDILKTWLHMAGVTEAPPSLGVPSSTSPNAPIAVLTATLRAIRNLSSSNKLNNTLFGKHHVARWMVRTLQYCNDLPCVDNQDTAEPSSPTATAANVTIKEVYNKTELIEGCLWCIANVSADKRVSRDLSHYVGADGGTVATLLRHTLIGVSYPVPPPGPDGLPRPVLFDNYLPGQVAEGAVWVVRNLANGDKRNRELLGDTQSVTITSTVTSGDGSVTTTTTKTTNTSICELMVKLLDWYKDLPVMTESTVGALITLCYDHPRNQSIVCAPALGLTETIYSIIATHAEDEEDLMDYLLKLIYALCLNNDAMQQQLLALRPVKLHPAAPKPAPAAAAEGAGAEGATTEAAAAVPVPPEPDSNILVHIRNIMYIHRRSIEVVKMGCECILLLHYLRRATAAGANEEAVKELQQLKDQGVIVDINMLPKAGAAGANSGATSSAVGAEAEAGSGAGAPPAPTVAAEGAATTASSSAAAVPPAPPSAPDATPEAGTTAPASEEWHVQITGGFQSVVEAWKVDQFMGLDSINFIAAPMGGAGGVAVSSIDSDGAALGMDPATMAAMMAAVQQQQQQQKEVEAAESAGAGAESGAGAEAGAGATVAEENADEVAAVLSNACVA